MKKLSSGGANCVAPRRAGVSCLVLVVAGRIHLRWLSRLYPGLRVEITNFDAARPRSRQGKRRVDGQRPRAGGGMGSV